MLLQASCFLTDRGAESGWIFSILFDNIRLFSWRKRLPFGGSLLLISTLISLFKP